MTFDQGRTLQTCSGKCWWPFLFLAADDCYCDEIRGDRTSLHSIVILKWLDSAMLKSGGHQKDRLRHQQHAVTTNRLQIPNQEGIYTCNYKSLQIKDVRYHHIPPHEALSKHHSSNRLAAITDGLSTSLQSTSPTHTTTTVCNAMQSVIPSAQPSGVSCPVN